MKTISLEDIYLAFSSSKPSIYKAITGLIFTSKMTPTILSKLTLNDLLESCGDYFEKNEEKTISNLLRKDPWKIIPSWKIKSDNIITFNTPETTFYIFLYLNEKRNDDLKDLDAPLFKSGKNNFLTPSKISAYVTDLNEVIHFFNKEHDNDFRSKNLINTFNEIYEKHMNIEIGNKENLKKLFEGKLAKNSKFYIKSDRNTSKIKEYYELMIPFLTARTYNIKFNKEYAIRSENIKKGIIEDYYKTVFKEKFDLEYGQEQLMLKFAEDLTDKYKFYNDRIYLNKLIKKALINLKLYNYDFNEDIFSFYGYYMEKSYSPELYASKIENTIDNLDIKNLIEFKEYELYKKIIKYVIHNEYYNKDILPNEAEDIIEDILFEAIDGE